MKAKISTVLILILFFQQFMLQTTDTTKTTTTTTSACGKGCIYCKKGSKFECLVCDSLMNYHLVSNICILDVTPNCLIAFEPGRCKICNYGFYLTGDFKCGEMNKKSKLAIYSCNFYLQADSCFVCDLYTYQRNGLCRPAFTRRENCTINKNDSQCSSCDLKIPSFDESSCDAAPTTPTKCLLYRSPVTCKTCKAGFQINENLYITELYKASFHQHFFFHLKFMRDKFFDIVFNPPVCESIYTISNCAELDYDKKCKTCSRGFTLAPDRTHCFVRPSPPENPKHRIPNCFIFETENYEKCKICYEGYYLVNSATKCQKHATPVVNCQIHSQTTDSNCVYCDNKYYLVAANPAATQCVLRADFFENCQYYDRILNKCTNCRSGHLFHFGDPPTTAYTKCSQKIANCKTPNIAGRVLKCSDCDDAYYLNEFSTACINASGTVEGCAKYGTGGTCVSCAQGYYLNDAIKKCSLHNRFIGCKTFSITELDKCDACTTESTRSQVKFECKQVDSETLANNVGCIQYDSSKNCITCEDKKVLYKSSNVYSCYNFDGCASLPSPYTDNSKCGTCMATYLKYADLCLQPISTCYYLFNKNSTQSAYPFKEFFHCEVCESNKYFKVTTGIAEERCILNPNPNLDHNCLNFNGDVNLAYVCNICKRGYYKNASNACIQLSANTGDKIFKNDYSEEKTSTDASFTGQWTSTNFKRCQVASSDYTKCLVCKNFNDGTTDYIYNPDYGEFTPDELKDPSTKSPAPTTYKLRKYILNVANVNEKINNEIYYEIDALSIYYCRTWHPSGKEKGLHRYMFTQTSGSDVTYYYLCKFNHLLPTTDVTVNESNFTIVSKLVETSHEEYTNTDYKEQWQTLITSSTVYQTAVCTSSGTIDNCSETPESTLLRMTWIQATHLSCTACAATYSLTYAFYKTTAKKAFGDAGLVFYWNINRCELDSSMSSSFLVSNCFAYKKTFTDEVYYECENCKAGYILSKKQAPFRCPNSGHNSTNSLYDGTTATRCKANYTCNKYLICVPSCNSGSECAANQYCHTDNTCKSTVCDPACSTGQICYRGTCKTRCQCKDPASTDTDVLYDCDSSTNYICQPKVCTETTGTLTLSKCSDAKICAKKRCFKEDFCKDKCDSGKHCWYTTETIDKDLTFESGYTPAGTPQLLSFCVGGNATCGTCTGGQVCHAKGGLPRFDKLECVTTANDWIITEDCVPACLTAEKCSMKRCYEASNTACPSTASDKYCDYNVASESVTVYTHSAFTCATHATCTTKCDANSSTCETACQTAYDAAVSANTTALAANTACKALCTGRNDDLKKKQSDFAVDTTSDTCFTGITDENFSTVDLQYRDEIGNCDDFGKTCDGLWSTKQDTFDCYYLLVTAAQKTTCDTGTNNEKKTCFQNSKDTPSTILACDGEVDFEESDACTKLKSCWDTAKTKKTTKTTEAAACLTACNTQCDTDNPTAAAAAAFATAATDKTTCDTACLTSEPEYCLATFDSAGATSAFACSTTKPTAISDGTTCTGCTGFACLNSICYTGSHCPTCTITQYCWWRLLDDTNGFKYKAYYCKDDSVNCTCTTGQFCVATPNANDTVDSYACQASAPLGINYGCASPCGTDEYCSLGSCYPSKLPECSPTASKYPSYTVASSSVSKEKITYISKSTDCTECCTTCLKSCSACPTKCQGVQGIPEADTYCASGTQTSVSAGTCSPACTGGQSCHLGQCKDAADTCPSSPVCGTSEFCWGLEFFKIEKKIKYICNTNSSCDACVTAFKICNVKSIVNNQPVVECLDTQQTVIPTILCNPACGSGKFCSLGRCYTEAPCPLTCLRRQHCWYETPDTVADDRRKTQQYVAASSCLADAVNCTCTAAQFCSGREAADGTKTVSCAATKQREIMQKTCTGLTKANTWEVCVNGYYTYPIPCFYSGTDKKMAHYCAYNQTCVDQGVSGKCEVDCSKVRACEVWETCNKTTGLCEPIAAQNVREIIYQCNQVVDCGELFYINDCKVCKDKYSFAYTGSVKDTPLKCKFVTTNNCVKATLKSGSTTDYECTGCQSGFNLVSGFCSIKVTNCKTVNDLGECQFCSLVYGDGTANGNEDRILVDGIFQTGSCLDFSYVPGTTPTDATERTKLEAVLVHPSASQHCKIFGVYFLNAATTALKNALQLKDLMNLCLECKTGYFINDSHQCIAKSITNCAAYNVATSTTSSSNCSTCDLGYALASNACTKNVPADKYLLPRCLLYGPTPFNCVSCESNYLLGQLTVNNFITQNTFCFKDYKEENCEFNDAAYFTTEKKIKCGKCRDISGQKSYPAQITLLNVCLNISARPNCIKHDVYDFTKTYECKECSKFYYLQESATDSSINTKTCVLRTKIDEPTCQSYYINQDKCEVAVVTSSSNESQAQLPTDQAILIAQPPQSLAQEIVVDFQGWIMGCDIYTDTQNCEKCYAHKYKNQFGFDYNTKCIEVVTQVGNCRYYSDSRTCEQCYDFFYLDKTTNQCKLIKAENCGTYLNESACHTCSVTYPYKNSEGHCTIDPLNPWCLEYDSNARTLNQAVTCKLCKDGYYPDDSGICRKLTTSTIPNCQYYASETLCLVCNSGTYLRYDGKQCIVNPQSDENCFEFRYQTECSVCEFKHYLVSGECKECVGVEAGCMYCDPKNPSACLICMFGYTHDGDKCVVTDETNKSNEKEYVRKLNYHVVVKQGVLYNANDKKKFMILSALSLALFLLLKE